jgi:hypothetical protein
MAKKIINNSTQQLSIEAIMESIEDNIFVYRSKNHN